MVVLLPHGFVQVLELQYTCFNKATANICVAKTSVQILVLERMNSKDNTKKIVNFSKENTHVPHE